ncbi:MAG: fumarate hydratase [Candidatus Altiarchaeota archaeon]|nr:fumarate hydratase [Candidatus Altiarchaeota archaeon]
MISEDAIVKAVVELIRKAETSLPEDVERALKKAYEREENELARIQLREILKNIEYARKHAITICQDTGLLNFYVKIGNRSDISQEAVRDAIIKATKVATEVIPLRPNVVHPLTRENSGNNTGSGIPEIEFEAIGGNCLEVSVLVKGAGSENMSKLRMLNPSDGLRGIKRFVLESVAEAGGNPCPPGVVGVGIGGSSNLATKMAKKALLRKVGERNKDIVIAELETELEEKINRLGIGAMGLGGTVSCLGVNIESAYCHTGSLPVAVNLGCWATRRAMVNITESGFKLS